VSHFGLLWDGSDLNSPEFKRRFPETGEDVKVMGYRCERELVLTIALAFVDRFVPDTKTYFARKQEIAIALNEYLTHEQRTLHRVTATINALDDPAHGDEGMYLTVLGTSGEGGRKWTSQSWEQGQRCHRIEPSDRHRSGGGEKQCQPRW